jgi:hypothetical protein
MGYSACCLRNVGGVPLSLRGQTMSTGSTSAPAPKEQIMPGPEGLKAIFPWRITVFILIGYLLSTVPQVILDPLFLSHRAYGARHYPVAWLIVPIAFVLFIVTLVVSSKTRRRRYWKAMIPFVVACAASIPIFPPEIPHGNLVFVSFTWFLFSIVTIWIHDLEVVNPAERNPKPVTQAQIEYIKQQTALWRTVAFGLIAIYLAGIVSAVQALHQVNATVVPNEREVWFLNQYSNLEMAIFSVFMMTGPIYEAAKKIVNTNLLLLSVSNGSSATSSSNEACNKSASP